MGSRGRGGGRVLRVTLLFGALTGVGLILSAGIELGYLPSAFEKSIMVQVEYHGADAEEMERIVVCPLEKMLACQRGLTGLFSVAEEGRCRVYIRFAADVDLDRAYLITREAVEAVYVYLPAAVQRPQILKSDYQSFPVFIAAFPRTSAGGEAELKRRFENIKGTGEIEIGGGSRREVQIAPDPDKCAAWGVSVADIVAALRRNNLLDSFGRETETPLLLDCRLESLEQMKNLAVGRGRNLGELASIAWRDAAPESIGRVNGREQTLVYVHSAGDANTVSLCRDLRRAASRWEGEVLYDGGRGIEENLLEILELVLVGIGLVTGLTLLFMGAVKPALLVCVSIPFAVLITLGTLRVLAREVNTMILSGLAVGVGLVIDAGVVFCEEFLAQSGDLDRTLKNTRSVLTFSAATTLAVFFPLLFAEQTVLLRFGDLALTVALTVAASLLYAFLFLPAWLSRAFAGGRSFPAGTAGKPFRLLRKCFLMLARVRLVPLLLLLFFCGGAAFLLPGLRLEGLLPPAGKRLLLVLEYPSGTSLNFVFSRAGPLESALASHADVEHVVARYQKERASFDITLYKEASRTDLRQRLRAMESGFRPAFFHFPEAAPEERPLEVVLTGTEICRLKELAEELSRRIAALPGAGRIVYHYKQAVPVRRIRVDLQKARRLGLDPYAVYAGLFWMLSEPVAAKWTRGGGETDIRLVRRELVAAEALLGLRAPGPAGSSVEIKNVASLAEAPGLDRIYHVNRRRSVSFSVLTDSASIRKLLREVERAVASSELPFGYHAEVGESFREQVRAVRAALMTLSLAVALIFLILLFGFENLTFSCFTLLQIPLAFVLPIFLLRLFSFPVSPPVIAGLILTAGVAVNNCIVVLAPCGGAALRGIPRRRRRPDVSVLLAVLERKLRAVLVASLTTVLGVFPVFFSSSRGLLPPLSLVMAAGIAGSLPLFLLSLALFAKEGDGRATVQSGSGEGDGCIRPAR